MANINFFISGFNSSFPVYFRRLSSNLINTDSKFIFLNQDMRKKWSKNEENEISEEFGMKLEKIELSNIYNVFSWFFGAFIAMFIYCFSLSTYFYYGAYSELEKMTMIFSLLIIFWLFYWGIKNRYSEKKSDFIVLFLSSMVIFPMAAYGFISANISFFVLSFLLALNVIIFLEVTKPILRAALDEDSEFFLYGEDIKFILIKKVMRQ